MSEPGEIVSVETDGLRRLVTRLRPVAEIEYQCPQCAAWFSPRRSDAVWCSDGCRIANWREKNRSPG